MSLRSLARSAERLRESRPKQPGYYVRMLGRPLSAIEAECVLGGMTPCPGYLAAKAAGDEEGKRALKHWWGPMWAVSGGFSYHPEWRHLWPAAVALAKGRVKR